MPYHLRQTRRVLLSGATIGVDIGTLVSSNQIDEIVFGGRGPGGLPVRTVTPGNFGFRYRSRALVNRKRSTQRLSDHLQKRKFSGTVNAQDDDQYNALILLTEMAERVELLHLVWTSYVDPSRVVSFGDWFVEACPIQKNMGVAGEMDTITYNLTLVKAD